MNGVKSILHIGTGGLVVEAECHLSNGLPLIVIVGLGNKAIEESKERIRSAFATSNIALPRKRITINLAPADIPKETTSFDLAMAVAILQANGQVARRLASNTAVIGELGLDGGVRPVRGIIGKLLAGKKEGITTFYIPKANLQQACLIPDVTLYPVSSLLDLYLSLNGEKPISEQHGGESLGKASQNNHPAIRISDVVGQQQAKRALEIAAAGGHNIFLQGPPGTGKSMLAKALLSILPPLNTEEMLEITHLHSLTSNNYDNLITARPLRAPHHSASHVAIIGGGATLRPGEISLSHRGILFLDELPEFNRATIEALRQPLEDRSITIARAKQSTTYPADFIMVGTANPCPCGYYDTPGKCECAAHEVLKYRQKLSGPILDRIDLYVSMEAIDHAELLADTVTDEDTQARKRVEQARRLQAKRYTSNVKLNSTLSNQELKQFAQLTPEAKAILDKASSALDLSARSYMRSIKVARTIADLGDAAKIEVAHITESLQYRNQSPRTKIT